MPQTDSHTSRFAQSSSFPRRASVLLGLSSLLIYLGSCLAQSTAYDSQQEATSTGVISEEASEDLGPLADLISEREMIEASIRQPFWNHPSLVGAPHYRIDMELDSDLNIYRGGLRLDYTNQEQDTLQQLNFLLYPNSAELSDASERRLIITEASVDGIPATFDRLSREVLTIPLSTALKPGQRTTVVLKFKGSLFPLAPQTNLSEFKLEDMLQTLVHQHKPNGGYGVFSHGDGIMSLALWYPILVAYDEDGWDVTPTEHVGDRSYFDIAHYDVSLLTDADTVVATTGVEVGRQRKGRSSSARFVAAGVREFSIQASKEYVKVENRFKDVIVRSFTLRRHSENNQAALNEAISALKTFETLFGPYPYQELELAESPLIGGAGGVEFPGLVTIGSMIYEGASGLGELRRDDEKSEIPQQRSRGLSVAEDFMQETRDFVIAHEVAHQWWAAVVGSDSRTHPFVDEALANYSAAAHFQRTRGPSATQRQLDMMMRLNYHLARFSGMEDQPVDQPTQAFDGMLSYGAIVYGKGALFFWKLRELLSPSGLHKALSEYYQEHQFKVAKSDALRLSLASDPQHREEVEGLTRRWLDERHGDEDIESVSLYRAMKIMLGEVGLSQVDPELRRWLNHRGIDALADLVEHALRTGKVDKERIDYAAITSLLTELMSEDPKVARWAGVASRVLQRPDPQPGDVLREAGREVRAEDPKMGLILESAGLLLDALMMEDQKTSTPSVPADPSHPED